MCVDIYIQAHIIKCKIYIHKTPKPEIRELGAGGGRAAHAGLQRAHEDRDSCIGNQRVSIHLIIEMTLVDRLRAMGVRIPFSRLPKIYLSMRSCTQGESRPLSAVHLSRHMWPVLSLKFHSTAPRGDCHCQAA